MNKFNEKIFRPNMFFGPDFSHFSLSLALPSGRKYVANVVKLGDSSVGAGIRRVPGKANSYPLFRP